MEDDLPVEIEGEIIGETIILLAFEELELKPALTVKQALILGVNRYQEGRRISGLSDYLLKMANSHALECGCKDAEALLESYRD